MNASSAPTTAQCKCCGGPLRANNLTGLCARSKACLTKRAQLKAHPRSKCRTPLVSVSQSSAFVGVNIFAELVARELEHVRSMHGRFNSAHEAWAVIAEELEEYWEIVRMKRESRPKGRMIAELVQIAAAAQRACEDLCLAEH